MNKDKVRKLIIDELDLHPQHPFWDKFEALQPTVSNEEVESIDHLINNVPLDSNNIEELKSKWNSYKTLLTTPKISDIEVEEALRDLVSLAQMRDDWKRGISPAKRANDNANVIKQHFQQMQKGFGSEHHKLFVKNKKYKQLLDKIELSKDELGWYIKVGTEREYTPFEVYNILKELKSIGGNK